MGHHSKPSKTKTVIRRTSATVALAGATIGGIAIAGGGTASAFPGQAGLVRCESGGNPAAVNNTPAGQRAGRPAGLFQIVTQTWLANGGGQYAPTADKATPAQQQIVADRIYAKSGSAPWQCHTGSGPAQWTSFGGDTGGGSATGETMPVHAQPADNTVKAAPKATSKAAPKASTPTAVAGSNPNGDYTVVGGDTLSGIAQKLGVSGGWQHLEQLNSQYIPNPNLILVGQKIATK